MKKYFFAVLLAVSFSAVAQEVNDEATQVNSEEEKQVVDSAVVRCYELVLFEQHTLNKRLGAQAKRILPDFKADESSAGTKEFRFSTAAPIESVRKFCVLFAKKEKKILADRGLRTCDGVYLGEF